MAPSLFADPDSGGGRPGNDVLCQMSHLRRAVLYRRTFGNVMLHLAAGVLYRRNANKGSWRPISGKVMFIRGKDMV